MNNKIKEVLSQVQKPGRYTGGEPGSVYKNKEEIDLRFAFCFPDTYEVGMSYLGMKILYELLNNIPAIWCERCFMPWVDMIDVMQENNIPLFATESKDPLTDFDIIGFTLQYELSYSNILWMLKLAGIPLRSEQRDDTWPIIVAGGPCVCNAEPLAPFIDAMFLGEGEEQLPIVCAIVEQGKKEKLPKVEVLKKLSQVEGVYVPAFYDVSYLPDGTVEKITATHGAPAIIHKALLKDFESFPLPENFVVPMVGAVHDRAQIEVLRGCVRGCRFCQAGFIYRPMRERSAKLLSESAQVLCDNTGYEEVSLTSLSTSDHTELEPLLDDMLEWTSPRHINLSLPSLRVDNFTEGLAQKTAQVRKTSLTFAPEAGTQRLRDVINKNVSEEEIDRTCLLAFNNGYSAVKLYFMMGLPTETMEDIEGIAKTAEHIVELFYSNPNKPKGKGLRVSISVACFVPKAMTPFQYFPQDSEELLQKKQKFLLESVKSKKVQVSYHDKRISFLEAVFAKGDRRLADVLELAVERGCRFDGWDDQFLFNVWMQTFEDLNIDPHFYANRTIGFDEVTPWSHLDYGVTDKFLQSEYEKAMQQTTTPPCNEKCSNCGANVLLGGACFAYH